VLCQRPPGGVEVILVDDGIDHPLDTLVAPHQDPILLTVLRQANSGPDAGHHPEGASIVRCQFLEFNDDDWQSGTNWLCAFDRVFTRDAEALLEVVTILNALHWSVMLIHPRELIVDPIDCEFNPKSETTTYFCSRNLAMSAPTFPRNGRI
jgi:hypothetical protein